mgnify:CR=1 FL=1|tara:strand:+ start:872 stop:1699 length:828 start_codon:yes stop_codon:yes gene_type:complete
MSDSKKVIDSLERENSINKDKIQSLQLMAGIYNEQLNSLTTNVYNNPILDTEPGIVESNKAIIVSKDGTIDNLNLTGNIVATNIKNYYQTTNSEDTGVGDLGFWNTGNYAQATDSGTPSDKDLWRRFTSWKTSGPDFINSNTNIFSPQNYGFKALVAGTYKVTVNMAFVTIKTERQNMAIRLAKNALKDDVQNSMNENPGPLGGTEPFTRNPAGYSGYSGIAFANVTHIMTLAAEDQVSLYTTNIGRLGNPGSQNDVENVFAREGYSQLLVEYLG